MVGVEEIVGNDLVVVIGSMCESAMAVAVTQRPDAGHVGLQLIVNDDVAALVDSNSGPVESQVAGVGSSSDCEKKMSAYCFRWTVVAFHADGDTVVALRQ